MLARRPDCDLDRRSSIMSFFANTANLSNMMIFFTNTASSATWSLWRKSYYLSPFISSILLWFAMPELPNYTLSLMLQIRRATALRLAKCWSAIDRTEVAAGFAVHNCSRLWPFCTWGGYIENVPANFGRSRDIDGCGDHGENRRKGLITHSISFRLYKQVGNYPIDIWTRLD